MSGPRDDDDLPEQIRVRRAKRQALIDRGVDPYPVRVDRTHTISDVVTGYDPSLLGPDAHTGDEVTIAGRVIFQRNTGKLCFVRLREGNGTEIQAMLSLADIGADALADYKALVDIGDHLAVTGEVVTSRRGELSVQSRSWRIASKTLRPLPNEHKPLSDEARTRLRYVDLIVRGEAREMVRDRASTLRSLRATLDDDGFVEIETPILQFVHGGATARPFRTHLNVFDTEMTLRIALELFLKRAVVGGIERVYEINRNFRNEGIDSTHAPEFTMLESYQAYGDWRTAADLTQRLIVNAADALGSTIVPDGSGGETDLSGPWRHVPIHELVSEALGEQVDVTTSRQVLAGYAEKRGIEVQPAWGAGELVVELFDKLVEPTLTAPTFVIDYPESTRPLARPHRETRGLCEAWDLIVAGFELGTGYSEMADPVVQRERLATQSALAAGGDAEAMQLDEDFLRALEYGMPPTGGMGMGIDRLLRLLKGVGIRETILFPLHRPG